MNKTMKFLLLAAMALAVAVAAVSFHHYSIAGEELSSLKTSLAESTSVWNEINDRKLVVLRELKEAKNLLRETDLILEESPEKIEKLETEISELEKEIAALRSSGN